MWFILKIVDEYCCRPMEIDARCNVSVLADCPFVRLSAASSHSLIVAFYFSSFSRFCCIYLPHNSCSQFSQSPSSFGVACAIISLSLYHHCIYMLCSLAHCLKCRLRFLHSYILIPLFEVNLFYRLNDREAGF